MPKAVPTTLIGRWVRVHVYEWHIEVYHASKLVETLPRLIGEQKHQVNYRHVIETLLRKPGGFRNYRYRDDLFPALVFRRAWDQLQLWYAPRKADLIYLRVLHLAARTLESEVACALDLLVAAATRWDETDVEQMVQPPAVSVPELTLGSIELEWYDQLLQEACHEPA